MRGSTLPSLEGPGVVLLKPSLPFPLCLRCREFLRIRAPPAREEHRGPSSYLGPCLAHLHGAGKAGSFFSKQIFSPEQPLSPTPSCLAHRLIHLSRIKRL